MELEEDRQWSGATAFLAVSLNLSCRAGALYEVGYGDGKPIRARTPVSAWWTSCMRRTPISCSWHRSFLFSD